MAQPFNHNMNLVFSYRIPSIRQSYPEAPPMFEGFDLNEEIAAGAPANFDHIRTAQALVDVIGEFFIANFELLSLLTITPQHRNENAARSGPWVNAERHLWYC